MNIILTIIHALKPSSLTHSLQIYCTGLTGPRSHTPWAWTAKRVLTIYIYIYIYMGAAYVPCSSALESHRL